jgi:O-antigen/teichoic acid export membrane protein
LDTSKIAVALKSRTPEQLIAHMRTPLYRNGYALMLSAAITSGLGFVYWMLATRLYTPELVGLNSAVISAMFFVAGVAQLSLVSVMTRFIPRAGRATGRLVGAAYLLTLSVAACASLVFVWGLDIWSPALAFLGSSPLFTAWFVAATMMWCLFVLQDSVLTGLKQTLWVPAENAIFAIAKIVLLMLFATPFVSYGIFASWTVPGLAVVLPISGLIFWRLIPRHVHSTAAQAEPIAPPQIARYAASNYLGSMLSLAVTTLLPLVVVHRLGASANAYFAQPWLIASALQMVAGNMALSLTVEAVTDRTSLKAYTRRALVHTMRLLVPMVLLILIGAPYLLQIFGPDYAAEGSDLLRLLALGTLPNVINMLYLSVVRVQDRVVAIVLLQGALCVLTLGLSHFLIPMYGITGVGFAWVASQMLVAIFVTIANLRSFR